MKKSVILRPVKSQSTSAWDESKEIGTLKANLEKTDIISLSVKNIEGDAKHIALFVRDDEDAVPAMLYCTAPLSKKIRKMHENKVPHRQILKSLMTLKLANLTVETDDGDETMTFIIAPGKQGEAFTAGELMKEEVVKFEDLI